MSNQASHMIKDIEQINYNIADAIQNTDFNAALSLDESRQQHLNALKTFIGPLSTAQINQLENILNGVRSEIMNIENAMLDLNARTSKHIKRLHGYL